MRKIGAYLLGVFMLLLLGAALLHPSLLVVADWLGPVFGSQIYGALTMAFLLFGDPIAYPVLLVAWVLVGLIVGGVTRRKLGGALIALLIWLTMIPIAASLVFTMAQTVPEVMSGAEGPLAGLPPLPSGLTLASIFEAPIVGKIAKGALNALSGGVEGQVFAGKIISGLAVDFAWKPALIVVAAIIGAELGKLVEKRGLGLKVPSLRVGGSKVAAIAIIACICLPIVYVAEAQTGDNYSEALVGALDKQGRSYVADMFTKTGGSLAGMGISATDSDGLAAAVVVSQSGFTEEFRKQIASDPELGEASSILNLLPPTFAVVVYVGVPNGVAVQRSSSVSRALSSTYGVDLSQLAAFTMEPESDQPGSIPAVTFAFYQSGSDIGVLADNYLTAFEGRGGFVDAVKGAVDNGRLLPGETGESASGSCFAAGFINMDALSKFVPQGEMSGEMAGILGAFPSGPVSFGGRASFWNHGSQPTGGADLDVLSLLGAPEAPSYSPESDLSLLVAYTPKGNETAPDGEPNVKITTNLPADSNELKAVLGMLEDTGVSIDVKNGAPARADFQLDATGLALPLNVRVVKTTSGGATATVTITVENRDKEPMTDVRLDDGATLASYSKSAELVSGSVTGAWDAIPAGQSRSITYSLRMDNPGVYTLGPASLTYAGGGVVFSDSSNRLEAVGYRPFPLFVPFELAALTWMTVAKLLDVVTGRGVLVMSVLTIGVLALVAYEGVRSYGRWRRRGDAEAPSEAHPPESGDTSAAPP